ncbi:MAG: Hpt domain-containing protein [Chitinophagaceae bacterium]|nr:Hpt domain-containing protein [Oligoflexus sp.]
MRGGDISADPVPLIDHAKLDAVKELAEPGDADGFFKDLVELFFSRVPMLIGEMVDANQKGDPSAISRSAHTLKGTAGNLGAIRVMKLAESLELESRAGKLDLVPKLLTDIESAYRLSKVELENNMTIPY